VILQIGELMLQSGKPLLRMWRTDVAVGTRPYTKHAHTRFEITVVDRGRGEYSTEKAVYPMEAGDVFVFSANEIHCITACSEEMLLTNLHFEPRYLTGEQDNWAEENLMNLCFSHAPDFENRIPAERAQVIRGNQERIKEEFEKGQAMHPIAVKAHLNLMLVDLFRNQGYCANNPGSVRPCSFDMVAVCDYISQHLCERITLDALAQIVHLSPNYFSHLFKALNGISLWDYITARRVERAVGLICGGKGITMLQIALECGFNSTVHFNKAFKKHTGLTPGQLRRNPELLSH